MDNNLENLFDAAERRLANGLAGNKRSLQNLTENGQLVLHNIATATLINNAPTALAMLSDPTDAEAAIKI